MEVFFEFILWLFGGSSKDEEERWPVWVRFLIFSVMLLALIGLIAWWYMKK
jgi:plastocyanin domain-containing protein